jgi:repressor LexA
MDTRTKRLKIAFENSGLTQTEVCERAGINKGAFSSYLSGRYFPKQKSLEKLSSVFNVSIQYLMGIDNVPVYEAAAGEGRYNDAYPSDAYSINLKDDEFLFRVVGRSMEPTLLDGDIVVVTRQSTVNYTRQIALVRINGEESTLKRVQIKKDGIVLIADNVNVYEPHFFSAEEVNDLPVRIDGIVSKVIREL